jgi:hypothetical protein
MKHLKGAAFGCISAAVLAWTATAADSIPDLSGEWGRTNFNLEAPPSGPGPVTNRQRKTDGTVDDDKARIGDYMHPLIRPEAAAILKKRGEFTLTGQSIPDPHNQCRPEPPPFTMTIQLELMLLQQKNEVTLIYVNGEVVRHVKMNVEHPKNLVPTWQGDSIGHYEGDTLVVDTIGIKTGPYAVIDRYGTPFSDKLHVIERYHLIDGKQAQEAIRKHRRTFNLNDTAVRTDIYGADVDLDPSRKGLQIDVTVDDPGTFTAPWKGLVTYTRGTGWPEMSCAESPQQSAGLLANYPKADRPDF